MTIKNIILSTILVSFIGIVILFRPTKEIDFNTEVKPIINKKCIACHGGVKQAGGFSLLFPEEAFGKTKSGKVAIVPGNASKSEFIRRLTCKDPEERMPKKGSLTKKEIETLTKWVDQGAHWGRHWAYNQVKETNPPVKNWFTSLFPKSWANNDIDHFIKEKHDELGLSHSKEADKSTILRRLTLDIGGLSPTEKEYVDFINDKSDKTYEKTVDRLLNSTDFGEKWASMWLDLARYADSKGYEKDGVRNIWRYRDWVIKAFNNNMPYDQFITEQLAGDLIPNATENQLIATAFHRNTMNNEEGGTVDEEFRTSAILDRVSTTWVAFNSTTFACTQCHSHPYDPFKHDEFYKFMAFFNNTRDEDLDDESSFLRFFNKDENLKITKVKNWINTNVSTKKANEYELFIRTLEPKINAHSFVDVKNGTSEPGSYLQMQTNGSARLKNAPIIGKSKMLIAYTSGVYGNTLEIRENTIKGKLIAVTKLDTSNSKGFYNNQNLFKWVEIPVSNARKDLYLIFKNPKVKDKTVDIAFARWVMFCDDSYFDKRKKDYAAMVSLNDELIKVDTDNMPIVLENPQELHRQTKVFERGNMYTQTKVVAPDVPKYLHPFPKNAPKNRLGLAQWITSKENSLTARTIVNRVWEQIFGTGLVETLEDMGTQGFSPTHQMLLDHLSYRLMNEWKWQLKPLIKEILLSATYRQDSRISETLLEKDPANLYLARGPRVRLTGEQIRDESLLVSGLISKKMYGKPVMPFQPTGVWQAVYNDSKWLKSTGEDAYRRAVYTYIRRSSPYPSMLTFDGSTRDLCQARRLRTNTPLQALVTLNDSTYLEMAQNLAIQIEKTKGISIDGQLNKAYFKMVGHNLPEKKKEILVKLHQNALARFSKSSQNSNKWMMKAKPETSALAVVLNTMLNMDEFITKE